MNSWLFGGKLLVKTISPSTPVGRQLHIGDVDIYSLKGDLLARVRDGTLAISAGYRWDGCTAIGRLVETFWTLQASLLHDFLYQIAEQVDYYEPYTQRQADLAFRRYLPFWAKYLWFRGVRAFGWAFYGGNEHSLVIKRHTPSAS